MVNMAEEAGLHLSGLEQLRALMAAGRRPGIGETMGFNLVEVADGVAVFEGKPDERCIIRWARCMAGYAATLLDSACGIAVHSKLAPGQGYTTLELKVAYHKAMTRDTGVVRAEGRVVTFGRRAAFAEAKLVDAAGKLLASATSSLLVITLLEPVSERAWNGHLTRVFCAPVLIGTKPTPLRCSKTHAI